jgi:predicted phosphate transport protein (TIGR00153 family)
MRLSLLPREDKFLSLLHRSCVNLQQISRKMQDLLTHYENVPEKVAEISALENRGDEIIHELFQSLHRSFVTPIDREDIAALAERLDDFVDAIEEAARYLVEYKIKKPTEFSKRMADILVLCADELETATAKLHYRGGRLKEILPHSVELNRLENEADKVVGAAMGDLFNNGGDAIDILKWRDIYNDLEGATDRAEDAANVLEGIVLKHA